MWRVKYELIIMKGSERTHNLVECEDKAGGRRWLEAEDDEVPLEHAANLAFRRTHTRHKPEIYHM